MHIKSLSNETTYVSTKQNLFPIILCANKGADVQKLETEQSCRKRPPNNFQ